MPVLLPAPHYTMRVKRDYSDRLLASCAAGASGVEATVDEIVVKPGTSLTIHDGLAIADVLAWAVEAHRRGPIGANDNDLEAGINRAFRIE